MGTVLVNVRAFSHLLMHICIPVKLLGMSSLNNNQIVLDLIRDSVSLSI
jgi:hypothetical protein